MSGVGAKMETGERVKESNCEKGENMGLTRDKEQITNAQYRDANVGAASRMGEVKEEEVEMQTKKATPQDRVEDNSQENTCLVQKTTKSTSLEESEIPSDHRPQPHSLAEEHKDRWDRCEVLIPHITETSELLCEFAPASTQMHPGVRGSEPYLPFPTGPGLTQAMQCPLLQFNAIQPLSAFEGDRNALAAIIFKKLKTDNNVFLTGFSLSVEWRFWQEKCENVPGTKTFPLTSACVEFTVMSYNILADDLVQANLDLYANCPWQVLDWNYRCRRILMEIQKWAPDVSRTHVQRKLRLCSH